MSISEMFGLVAGTIGVISSLPQSLKIRKSGSSAGVSRLTWSIMFISGSFWLGYGIKTHSLSQEVSNAVALILISTVLIGIFGSSVTKAVVLIVAFAGFVFIATALPLTALAIVLLLFALTRIPQVITSYRRYISGGPSAVSMHTWALSTLSGLIWLIYAVLAGRGVVELNALSGITFGIAILYFEGSNRGLTEPE